MTQAQKCNAWLCHNVSVMMTGSHQVTLGEGTDVEDRMRSLKSETSRRRTRLTGLIYVVNIDVTGSVRSPG